VKMAIYETEAGVYRLANGKRVLSRECN
jgi:hypothetical protein